LFVSVSEGNMKWCVSIGVDWTDVIIISHELINNRDVARLRCHVKHR
jgi:hypothetical protein